MLVAEPHSDRDALIRQAVAIAQQYAGEVTESGTPVADLALLLALRRVGKGDLPRDLATTIENNLAIDPSFLSPTILDEVAASATTESGRSMVVRLRDIWQQQESSRQRTREIMQDFVRRLQHWFAGPTLLYSYDGVGSAAASAFLNSGKPGQQR